MNTRILRLDGERSSYIIDASGDGIPRCCYWGRRLPTDIDLNILPLLLQQPLPQASLDQNVALSLLPEFGFGWFGHAGLMGCRDRRDWTTAFTLQDISDSPNRLIIHCKDAVAALELILEISIDPDSDMLLRTTELRNNGDQDYRLEWCAAAVYPVPLRFAELLNFEGQWSQEFQERRLRPGIGNWSRENRRGRTSHDSFPQLIIGTEGFSEESGEVCGFHLGWSGNHRLTVECQNTGTRQIQLGEWLAPGEQVLKPGESYRSPSVFASYSATGLNTLAHNYHSYIRTRILNWPGKTMRARPVHLNTWEALYFDHRLEDLQALARLGAAVGVERFVLDDGWFKGRNNDRAGLGDWTPDAQKYPQGLGPLVDYVTGLGMEFGLWIEPEMVNQDSDLFRAHPGWALQLQGRPLLTGRNQLVLDLTQKSVSDYLFDSIGKLLRDHPISYLKWDMNRDLVAAGGEGHDMPVYRQQTLAFYTLLNRFRQTFPAVEIESCASGGARTDLGVLSHTHRIWTSDNNDPLERQTIQRGFLRFFPPEIMGAHIGPSPAHIGYRHTSLAFRAATALFGHLGLELDVRKLSDAERDELKIWIDTYKQFRGLLHSGKTHLLRWREDAGRCGHGVVSPDKQEALFAVVQLQTSGLRIPPPIRLPGLDAEAVYRLQLAGAPPPRVAFDTDNLTALQSGKLKVPGAVLANLGLQPPILPPQSALLLHLQRIG